MRWFSTALITGLIVLPTVASATDAQSLLQILLSQVAALKSQIAALQEKSSILPGVRVCVAPLRNLSRGDSGDDVANLQIFLARDPKIYPEGLVVGEFGPATERAVQRWQTKYGIVTAGTPATSGFGAVGPRTLELMQRLWECGGQVSAGWFNANTDGGKVTFSAQLGSALPLDQSLYVETGDGQKAPLSVSTAVCKTLGGECSSVLNATHTYKAGTYTATLRRAQTTQQCLIFSQTCVDGIGICGSIAPSCTSDTVIETLATTTIVSNGVANTSSAAANPGTTATGQSVYNPALPASIKVLSPITGSTVLLGGSLTIAWSANNIPAGASVSLSLKTVGGTSLGTLTYGQKATGTYWWVLPTPSTGGCVGDAFTCLTQLANPTCTGDICSLSPGSYMIVAQVISGSSVLASSASPAFSVTSSPLAVSIATSSTSSSAATNSTGSTSSTGALGALPGDSATPSAGSSCIYSGIPYGNNITLQVGCTDLAGLSCGNFGTLSLTCKNGTWVDGSGSAVLVPQVTNFGNASSTCTTPWGSQKVQSGQQITYEPFFTSGSYSGINPMPLMQCSSGSWQKCNWDGTGCKAYSVI